MSSLAEQDWLLEAKGGSVRDFFGEIGVFLPDRSGANVDVPASLTRKGIAEGIGVHLAQ